MDFKVGRVVDLIGGHLADGGESVRTGLGANAAGTANGLVETVMSQLKSQYPNEPAVRWFERDPSQYAGWVRETLTYEMQSDPDFGSRVRTQWAKLEAEAPGTLDTVLGRPGEAGEADAVAEAVEEPAAASPGTAAGLGAAPDFGREDFGGPPPGPITIPDKPK